MGFLFLLGLLTLFGNLNNPDIQIDTIQAESSYYHFEDRVIIYDRATGKDEGSFHPNGTVGAGVSSTTRYLHWPNFFQTLNFRHYAGVSFDATFYTTGIGYETVRPNTSIALAIGGEFGIADLNVNRLKRYGHVPNTVGWEVYTMVTNHFVFSERIWHYFVRPTFRSYTFDFNGKGTVNNKIINAEAIVFAFGIGTQF